MLTDEEMPAAPPPPGPPPHGPSSKVPVPAAPVAPARAKPRVHPPPQPSSPRHLASDVSPRAASEVSQHRHKCRLLHRNRRGHALPKATGPVLPLAQQGGDNESSSDELIPMIAASRHNCLKPLALRNQKVMQIPMLPDTTRMKKAILSLMKKTGLCSLRNKSCAAIPNRARCRDTKAVVWWTFRGVTSRIRFDKTRYRPSHKNRSDIREEYGLLTREDEALSLSR